MTDRTPTNADGLGPGPITGYGPMTDRTPTTEAGRHPVYPGGPDCQPNCPGPWSDYHDGYADGYENAEARAGLDRLLGAVRDWMRYGAGDGTEQAEADSQNLLHCIATEYAALTRSKP